MSTVTINEVIKMSLENEIKELNATIKVLIATLQNRETPEPVVMVSAPEQSTEQVSGRVSERVSGQAVEIIETVPTFEQVQSAFVKFIAEKGRDAALAILKRHGVDGKLTEGKLPVGKYSEFIADCKL